MTENETQPENQAAGTPGSTEANPIPVECPTCGHHFLHNLGHKFKEAGESIGNALGEAKFGG